MFEQTLKPYKKYKDSGVEWLGEIPAHWEVRKLKYLTYLKSGNSITSENIRQKGDFPVYGGNGLRGYAASYTHEGQYILIGRQGALCGNINYAKGKFFASEHAIVVSKLHDFEIIWLGELLRTINLNQYSQSAAQPGLSVDVIKNLFIPIAPKEEQQKIASYLNRKTRQADTFIEKQTRLIELLKEQKKAIINKAVTRGLNPDAPMKESGIEWLGEIPAHWEVKKLKFISEIKGRIGFRGYTTGDLVNEGEGALTLGAKHINENGSIDLSEPVFISWKKYFESPEIMIAKNDIAIVQRGSTCGKSGLILDDIGKATINPSLVLLKKIKESSKFISYILKSDVVWKVINDTVSNTAIPMLSQEQISNFRILLPPLIEQQQIVSHIETKTAKIDCAIEKAEKEITLAREYLQSLIYHVVTGQLAVNNAED